MTDARGRDLTIVEHQIAEQGLLNLVLQADVRVLYQGGDMTPSLIAHAERINAQFDLLARDKSLTELADEMLDRTLARFKDPVEVVPPTKRPTPAVMPAVRHDPPVPKAKRASRATSKPKDKSRESKVGPLPAEDKLVADINR